MNQRKRRRRDLEKWQKRRIRTAPRIQRIRAWCPSLLVVARRVHHYGNGLPGVWEYEQIK